MTRVFIHQLGLHLPQGRTNWQRTLASEVQFSAEPAWHTLTESEKAALMAQHPSGRAHFWGAHSYYTERMQELDSGDVVIFPGDGHVQAFGVLGQLLDNPAFADTMWPRHPVHGSYRHVYSLASLRRVAMPYDEFRARGEFGPRDDFRGIRFPDDDASARLLAEFAAELTGLGATAPEAPVDDARADRALVQKLGPRVVEGVEAMRTDGVDVVGRVGYRMRRGEAALVQEFVAWLGGAPTAVFHLRTSAGITDVNINHGTHTELVEAKVSAGRAYVRQALAQLLDYAPAMAPAVPDVLTALLPERPDDESVALLHTYGIDCVYRKDGGGYEREASDPARRAAVREMWERPTVAP